jgi:hypothetical protein
VLMSEGSGPCIAMLRVTGCQSEMHCGRSFSSPDARIFSMSELRCDVKSGEGSQKSPLMMGHCTWQTGSDAVSALHALRACQLQMTGQAHGQCMLFTSVMQWVCDGAP